MFHVRQQSGATSDCQIPINAFRVRLLVLKQCGCRIDGLSIKFSIRLSECHVSRWAESEEKSIDSKSARLVRMERKPVSQVDQPLADNNLMNFKLRFSTNLAIRKSSIVLFNWCVDRTARRTGTRTWKSPAKRHVPAGLANGSSGFFRKPFNGQTQAIRVGFWSEIRNWNRSFEFPFAGRLKRFELKCHKCEFKLTVYIGLVSTTHRNAAGLIRLAGNCEDYH